jgi:hypothetical protein
MHQRRDRAERGCPAAREQGHVLHPHERAEVSFERQRQPIVAEQAGRPRAVRPGIAQGRRRGLAYRRVRRQRQVVLRGEIDAARAACRSALPAHAGLGRGRAVDRARILPQAMFGAQRAPGVERLDAAQQIRAARLGEPGGAAAQCSAGLQAGDLVASLEDGVFLVHGVLLDEDKNRKTGQAIQAGMGTPSSAAWRASSAPTLSGGSGRWNR